MIGLGSNRLTVCRRGGMRVTQAGKGGMEWLAGGRGALWASPYSAQATAALKAQFPTQWPTIRDYGFAHPEIVGYMNAYAPEDAKIAYSLVEGIGTRWLRSDGNSWIDTGIAARSSLNVEIKTKNITRVAGENLLLGSGVNWSNMYGINWSPNNTKVIPYIYYDGVSTTRGLPTEGIFTLNQSGFYIDGVQYLSKSPTTTGSTRNIFIFAVNWSSVSYKSIFDLTYAHFTENGADVAKFVPYKSATYGMGMLDLLSGTFCKNLGTGAFEDVIESPA